MEETKDSSLLDPEAEQSTRSSTKSKLTASQVEHRKENSKEQERRIRAASQYGHLKSWRLMRLIVKSKDDVRQEQFAVQLISQID